VNFEIDTKLLEQLDPKVVGEELLHARKKAGMTQADAAEILGVARTTVTAIESGDRRIRPLELFKLSSAYGRPLASFVNARPAVDAIAPQFRASFRNRPQWERELESTLAEIEDLLKDYLELYRLNNLQPPRRDVPEYPISGLTVANAAESVATAERNRLSLGDGPVADLRTVLEQEAGISVFFLSLPGWCCGLYLYVPELGGLIIVNLVHPTERQRQTMSHEYLHFLTSRHGAEVTGDSAPTRLSFEEKLASEFPSHFLMPAAGIRRRIGQLKQSTGGLSARGLIDIAAYYGVSVEALLRWLEELKLLPAGTFDEAKRLGFPIRRIQAEAGIDPAAERNDKLPLAYQQLAFRALEREIIPEGRFAELLRIDRVEARRLTRALMARSPEQALTVELVAG
jgi:Zn-dependent peptidase ImmA (M78 family)/transcriptional regulator with XRE-family HTH domain